LLVDHFALSTFVVIYVTDDLLCGFFVRGLGLFLRGVVIVVEIVALNGVAAQGEKHSISGYDAWRLCRHPFFRQGFFEIRAIFTHKPLFNFASLHL